MKELLPALLAFSWHAIDGALTVNKSHNKMRKFWVGVGIGWSAFMLAKLIHEQSKTKYITTKS